MVANFSRVRESTDVDELVFWLGHVREAARNFAELAERFRLAPSRSRTPSVLKHDVNTVFAVHAGELLCQCWRRGMFSVYRPHFYLPEEGEPRIRYVFSWFTFIRWHLAPMFKNRFRADWQSEFAPEMDQLKGQKHRPPSDFTAAVSDDAKELAVWRLDLCADVQATACAILAEELEQLLGAVEQRLGQLSRDQDEDLSAYLPAKTVLEFVPDKFSGSTALKKYCKEKGVPFRNPKRRRLVVHIAKLLDSLRSDEPDNEDLSGIVERYATYREERDRLAGK